MSERKSDQRRAGGSVNLTVVNIHKSYKLEAGVEGGVRGRVGDIPED